MARRDMELQLLELRFKHYTSEVRECISRTVRNQRCEDTSDAVIDELWESCRSNITPLLLQAGFVDLSTYQDEASKLAIPAREFIRNYVDQARTYEGELADSEDAELEELYRTNVAPLVRARCDRRVQNGRDDDRRAFFNQPDAEADFARWRGRLLNPAQAVALSFGKDPDVVNPESLQPYRRISPSPFREAFKDRLDLVEAAVAARELSIPVSVSSFADWAVTHDVELPPELTGNEPAAVGEDAAYWKAKFVAAESDLDRLRRGLDDDLWPKSKDSAYRLILGMAVARFGHIPYQRSKATSLICSELERIGIKIRAETVLDHLRDAAREIEYRPPKAEQ